MRRRQIITLLGGATIAWASSASAQRPARVSRIGILQVVPETDSLGFKAFRERLGDLGHVEGPSVAFEYRWSDKVERLPALVTQLTALKVDIIVTADSTTTRAAKQGTKDIPIVAAVFTDDPVAAGLVGSLGHPGGNVTGTSFLAPEMSGKRLELLREIVPGLTRVAVLWSRHNPSHPALLHATDQAAHALGITVIRIEANAAEDIEAAFQLILQERAEAVDMLQAAQFSRIRRQIANLGLNHRLPVIAASDGFVQVGGLIKYGPSTTDAWRRAAVYVAKILNGAKPADLPVEQATKFELAINLKTAKALGLTILPSILVSADEVIE
jgi:putative ABC transport system substrate-binding protein